MQAGSFAENIRPVLFGCMISAALLAGSLAWGGSAHADALSNLRITLGKLSSQSPVAATLEVKSSTTNKKENGGKPTLAEAHFDLQAGGGLTLHISADTLRQADAELQAAVGDADHPTPTADLLANNTNSLTLEHLISRGPALLRLLSSASAASVSSTTLWGEPARELVVQLPKPKSKNISLKDYQHTVSVWLDPAGVPLAYADHSQFKACLLFLCATTDNTESDRLEVINGRLVAATATRDQKLSGLGQDSDTHIVYTLSVQAANPKVPIAKPNISQ